MKRILLAVVASLFFAGSAFAATTSCEFANHCAYGLTMGKQVPTDGKITWKDDKTGKTYCFSSEEAKSQWAKDTMANEKKASAEFSKVAKTETTHTDSKM